MGIHKGFIMKYQQQLSISGRGDCFPQLFSSYANKVTVFFFNTSSFLYSIFEWNFSFWFHFSSLLELINNDTLLVCNSLNTEVESIQTTKLNYWNEHIVFHFSNELALTHNKRRDLIFPECQCTQDRYHLNCVSIFHCRFMNKLSAV